MTITMGIETAATGKTLGQAWLEAAIADQDDLQIVHASTDNRLEDIDNFSKWVWLLRGGPGNNYCVTAVENQYVLAPLEPEFSIHALNKRLRQLALSFDKGYLYAPKERQEKIEQPALSPHFNLSQSTDEGNRLIVARTQITEKIGAVRANLEIKGELDGNVEETGAAQTFSIEKVSKVSIFPDTETANLYRSIGAVFIRDRKTARRLRREQREFWSRAAAE